MSLYVTNIESAISNENPKSWIWISVFSLRGFFLIASIINKTIFPPSNAGIGNKFVIPKDTDIIDNIYAYSIIPDVPWY